MIRWVLLFTGIGAVTSIHAQSPVNTEFLSRMDKKFVQVSGAYQMMTSTLSNGFAGTLYYGGFISEEMKNRENLRKFNRVGAYAQTELLAANLWTKDSSKIKWGVVAGNYNTLSWKYTDDFFNLLFRGNKSYVGKVADMSSSEFSIQQFSKLGAVLSIPEKGFLVSLSFVGGQNFSNGFFPNWSLYTHPDVAQLDMTVKGNTTFSDTAHTFFKGLGAALDVYWRAHQDDRHGYLNIYAVNIGQIYWQNTVNYSLDTTYSYSGFDLNKLFDSGSLSTDVQQFQDSLLPEATPGSTALMLPGFVGVEGQFAPTSSDRWLIQYAAHASFMPGYRLFTSLGLVYRQEKWNVATKVNHGGFGRFSNTLEFNYLLGSFSGGVALFQPQGFLLSTARGKGVSLRLCKYLN